MKLTKATEYGILTMLQLAKAPVGQLSDCAGIAEREGIPASFLSKLVPMLVRAGLVRSQRGSAGGIELARAPEGITLRAIVEAIEGEIVVNACTSGTAYACFRSGCAIQGALQAAQDRYLTALAGFTLAGLAAADRPLEAVPALAGDFPGGPG